MNDQSARIEEAVESEKKAISDTQSFHEKFERQNNLLQMKLSHPNSRYNSEIYLEIKYFIKYYLMSLDERKNNYDEIQLPKIYLYFEKVSLTEKIKLSQFLIRQAKLLGYEEITDSCEAKLKSYELENCLKSFSINNLFKSLYLGTTYNLLTVLLSFALIYLCTIIFLLPAPDWSAGIVRVEYHNYSSDFLLNHLINLIGAPFEMSDDFKVIPLNVSGFFLCLVGKLFFLIILFNVLVKQLENKIKF